MLSVGAYLRQLREARGVSLEEIARITRVNPAYLQALEADDYASLPVPVFTRGFIRAYCQALGEPPDQANALFDGRGEPSSPGADPAAPAPARSAGTPRPVSETPRNRGPVLVSFILLVVLGIALFAVTLALQSGREAPESPRAARSTPLSEPSAVPTRPMPSVAVPGPGPVTGGAPASGATSTPGVASTPGVPAPAPAAPSSPASGAVPQARPAPSAPGTPGYRLVARTVEPTWMCVRTEDGKTSEETIPAGETREWFSTGPFTLTIGNAGGVALELNGRALPPLGASGVVIPRLVLPTESQ